MSLLSGSRHAAALQNVFNAARRVRCLNRRHIDLRRCLSVASFVGLFVGLFVAPFLASLHAQQPRRVTDGVYTEEQATRGQAVYKERCATCHGATLGGAQGPPLAGDDFMRAWGGPLSALVDKIQNTMPANEPGKLTRQQSADLVAHILQVGKFPAGRAELVSDDAALKQITIPAASQPSAPAASANAAAAPSFPPAGNMAQLMRGVLFPSSNLIFNVQGRDPGLPLPARPSSQVSSGAFPWADWGAGIYTGWELVDYAAVALAESAPLMLTPGRRCENGKPVPVTDADWINFTVELAEAGKAAYKASQTRKQDVVSEVTDQVATACSHCHEAYRDKPGNRNGPDPSNKAARCVR
jgi:mono/diheme cytochrome c family protein